MWTSNYRLETLKNGNIQLAASDTNSERRGNALFSKNSMEFQTKIEQSRVGFLLDIA